MILKLLKKRIGSLKWDQKQEKTRIAFISDRLDGKSHKEIAEELGISVKGVEYHISKAVKLLRDNLKEYAPFLIFFI